MNAVGIDVSKGKSMVAALRPMGEVAMLPQEFLHTEVGLEQMAYTITALGEDTRVVMEATGRYHEPVAAALHEYGIYVCVLNPLFIKQSGGGSIRKVKTDKADAMKIAKYGLDNWVDLREYTPMDTVRQQPWMQSADCIGRYYILGRSISFTRFSVDIYSLFGRHHMLTIPNADVIIN